MKGSFLSPQNFRNKNFYSLDFPYSDGMDIPDAFSNGHA